MVRGFVIAAAMVTVLLAFSPSPPPRSVVDSKILPYVINVSDVLAALTPREIKDQFYATKDKVKAVWSAHNTRKPDGAPARMNLLIFDLDGTLIDSKLDLVHSVNAARALMNLGPISEELVSSYVGNGAPVLMRRALGPEASEADVARALEYFLSYYRAHMLDNTRLYPGVREALDRLLAGRSEDGGAHQ